jgi:LmbE family N-acetylglucosaminyl deacetylase
MTPPSSPELTPITVLGIAAHPDDLDFGAGGTVAKWAAAGARVYFLVLTSGGKGAADPQTDVPALIALRQAEQQAAAKILGVAEVIFGGFEDGALENSIATKHEICRAIRRLRPEVVIGFDPTYVYSAQHGFINHPDHRAAGQATLDAVYPFARDALSFPELLAEGLEPHITPTLLLMRPDATNYSQNVTGFLSHKRKALAAHASQNFPSAFEFSDTEHFVRIDVQIS